MNIGGASTTLTFTITNPNVSIGLTVVGFTDTLPGGLLIATASGLGGTCNGGATITATGGTNIITMSGGTIAGGGSCTVVVNVIGATVGVKNNISGNVTSSNGGTGNTATASITVYQPTVTTIGAAAVQCTDVVTLSATVSPLMSPGSVEFFVDGDNNGFTAGDSIGVGVYTPATGIATQSYTCILGAGLYPIKAVYTPTIGSFYLGSMGTNTLTVTKEDTIVTPLAGNPTAVPVASPGGTSIPFSLVTEVVEVADGSLGDISLATVSCTLTPVGPGSPVSVTATTVGSGPGGTLTATCAFNMVPVNVYEVTYTVGGNCYTGSAPACSPYMIRLWVSLPAAGGSCGQAACTRSTLGSTSSTSRTGTSKVQCSAWSIDPPDS